MRGSCWHQAMSLRLRLNLLLGMIVVVTLAGATWSVVNQARQAVADELRSSVDLTGTLLEAMATQAIPADAAATFTQLIKSIKARHLDIQLIDEQLPQPPRAGRKPRAPRWFVGLVEPDPIQLRRRIPLPQTSLWLEVRADPADELDESWRETSRTLITLLSLALALVFLFARWGRLVLWPLNEIRLALGQVEAGRYATRLTQFGIPELDAIAEGFNKMALGQERDAAEVAELARRALVIREEERRRLAHELHDEMGQSISAIKALAVSISRRALAHDPRITQSADTIAEVSTRVYERVRQMMSQLRPTALDELGLVSALADMIDTWNSHHENVFCGFAVNGKVPPLSAAQSINLFRIVQEALTNIAKHASAANASVMVDYHATKLANDGELSLLIKDDGVGFEATTKTRGLGLVGISERVKALGGKLTLATQPGSGTQFTINIPLNEYLASNA